MRSLHLVIVASMLFGSIGILAGSSVLSAQDPIKIGTGREELNRPSTRPAKPAKIYGTRTKTVVSSKNAHPTITTGTLSVAAPPNAAIRVEPVKGGEALEGVVPANEGLFIFPSLKPGAYRVAGALNGHKPTERRIQIVAKRNEGLTLDLEPILYTVRIVTTVGEGEVRYAPIERYTEGGEKKYRTTDETRVVPIDSQNRTAVIQSLREGTYGIDIRPPTAAGYEERYVNITVPDDTEKEVITLDVPLKNARSLESFFGSTSDQWDLPSGWGIDSYVLSTNGKGIAIPHNDQYRHYTDFQMISDVRMVNGIAVSFILRASTSLDDYYLIRITGAKAKEPFLLSSYVVENGLRQPLQSVPIAHLASTLKENQYFTTSIKMKDNKIEVSVADSQTGKFFKLGVLVDPSSRFSIGAVGVLVDGQEKNQFFRFTVCNSACATQ